MITHLVLAHHSVEHLRRLVEALTAQTEDVVLIHVDGRRDLHSFVERIPESDRVRFIDERHAVYWGGWGMVAASVGLLRAGQSWAPESTHFQLISGDAFPVQDPRRVSEILATEPQTSYINMHRFPQASKPQHRIRNYYIQHDPRSSRFAKALKIAHRLMWRPSLGPLRELQLYCGSQWWTLSAVAADDVLAFVDENPAVVSFLRHTQVPDEHFFQIALANTGHRENCRPALFYADFTPVDGPRPAVLTAAHIELLEQTRDGVPTTWARKFSNDSKELTATVRRRLWPHVVARPTGTV